MKKREQIGKRQRWLILARDGFACVYCGMKATETELHVDHVKAVALGGTSDDDNLVSACVNCNLGKSALPMPAKKQPDITGQQLAAIVEVAREYDASYKNLLLHVLDQFEAMHEREVSLPVASLALISALICHASEIWRKTQPDETSKQRFLAICAAQFDDAAQ